MIAFVDVTGNTLAKKEKKKQNENEQKAGDGNEEREKRIGQTLDEKRKQSRLAKLRKSVTERKRENKEEQKV